MCSVLSLRKQVSTCSAKQSQLLRRPKGDFHKAINFLALQTVVSSQSQSYAQTHEKDSGLNWELSEELRWELHLGSWEVHKPGAQADPGNRTECGGRAKRAMGATAYKCSSWRAQSDMYYGHSGTPISLCFLPPVDCPLMSWSSREEAGNSINDIYQLIGAMHRSLNSKYAA